MIEPYNGSLWGFWIGAALFVALIVGVFWVSNRLFPIARRRR